MLWAHVYEDESRGWAWDASANQFWHQGLWRINPHRGGTKKISCDGGGLNQKKDDEMKNRRTSWLETRPGGGERFGVESAGWMCLSSSRLGAEMDFGQSAESEVSPMAAACVAAQHAPVLLTFRWWRSTQPKYMLQSYFIFKSILQKAAPLQWALTLSTSCTDNPNVDYKL